MAKEIRRPNYTNCDDLVIAGSFSPDAVRSAINYKPKPNDLFIVTYPKCGTTWTQHIVMLILRKGRPFEDEMDFFQSTPFIELTGTDAVDMMAGPGAIKIHLPLNLAPFSPKARYIYVARNPKDCCVSFYHHTKNIPFYRYADAPFSDFFELFLKGEVEFGDYFDHLIPWYEHRNDPNVYFVTYEDLKKDTKGEVLKLAKFIGEDYYKELQNDPQYLKNVMYYSSFEYMKNKLNADFDNMFKNQKTAPSPDAPIPSGVRYMLEYMIKNPVETTDDSSMNFIRKGVVGDWKNHFTPEQEKRMADYIAEKTAGTDVMSLWENHK